MGNLPYVVATYVMVVGSYLHKDNPPCLCGCSCLGVSECSHIDKNRWELDGVV